MKLTDLSWEDLSEQVGSRVVARAKSHRGAVEDLRVTAEGALVARVCLTA